MDNRGSPPSSSRRTGARGLVLAALAVGLLLPPVSDAGRPGEKKKGPAKGPGAAPRAPIRAGAVLQIGAASAPAQGGALGVARALVGAARREAEARFWFDNRLTRVAAATQVIGVG